MHQARCHHLNAKKARGLPGEALGRKLLTFKRYTMKLIASFKDYLMTLVAVRVPSVKVVT